MVRTLQLLLIVVGSLTTYAVCAVMFSSGTNTAMVTAMLLGAPAWAYAHGVASNDADFADGARSREEWLRLLSWSFLLAPLVIPNLFLLVGYTRDSRADSGRTWLGSGRTRPGER